ncbi:hypothetical protein ACSV5M_19205 [Cellvibrio sp. ARAG 10.3]|uniref:hypothetical protein n=1 Tax=Cellvibrio sp. ARAG 10.3 TaxID=3451358 RepID=UPI003F45FE9F
MLASHMDAEQRYTELRKLALEYAQADKSKSNLKLSLITPQALKAAKSWTTSTSRKVDWDWLEGYSSFKFRYPKRFEVALWQSANLITLSIGRPTYNGTALRLDFIEARPKDLGPRPSVFGEVLVAYGIYARLLNAKQIRIMHPIDDGVKSYYSSFGYTYVPKKDYLYRDVL